MEREKLVTNILDEAFYVHRKVGPGMLESVYKTCLGYRLDKAGFSLEIEKPIPLVFEDVKMGCGFRADLLVEKSIILEIKCVDAVLPIHKSQVLTYLRCLGLKLGIILNFNTVLLKNGIYRVIN